MGKTAVGQAPTSISLRLEATAAAVGVVNNWVSTLSPRSLSRRGMCQATKLGEDSVLDYPPTQHLMEIGKELWKLSCRKRRIKKKVNITECLKLKDAMNKNSNT